MERDHLSIGGAHRFQGGSGIRSVDVTADDARAFLREQNRGSAAHAPAGPGDDAHLAFESIAHSKVAST